MRQNPHVRTCGGPGSATTLVYPTTRRCPGGRAPLRGAASHEAEGGGGTDRVGPPPGWRLPREGTVNQLPPPEGAV